MAAQQISLHSSRLDAPAVSTLIHHAGVQHDPVLAGRRHGTAVRFADLADGGNFIGTGAQLSGQGNLIPDLQGMDPVSYTHLDVYKRQPLHRPHHRQLQKRGQ